MFLSFFFLKNVIKNVSFMRILCSLCWKPILLNNKNAETRDADKHENFMKKKRKKNVKLRTLEMYIKYEC